MKRFHIFLFILISIFSFAQNQKKFDLEIFEYLVNTTEKESTSLETFINNSKPFSKWDIRPLKAKEVQALDSIYTSSQIPNFIWGAFSGKYNLSEQEGLNKPNDFLDQGIKNQTKSDEYLKSNIKNFNELSEYILKSNNSIYLNQKNIQRIDKVFKEKDHFWSYIIPEGSPFPISPEFKTENKFQFSKQQTKILTLLNDLNIYCAVKTDKGIFYLIDGFTDNSYGFYYNKDNVMEGDHILFEIMKSEKIIDNYFYYIAN